MENYCIQDTLVTAELYKVLIQDSKEYMPKVNQAIKLEHEFAEVISRQIISGYKLDIPKVEDGSKIILAATHNARLQCFINSLPHSKGIKSKKFMNCAVIKCVIMDNKMKLYMVYEGELDSSEGKDRKDYWTYKFNQVFSDQSFDISYDNHSPLVIFLIRHGQGYHNLYKKSKPYSEQTKGHQTQFVDAQLTLDGTKQAVKAAEEIKKNINLDKII